jgi:hypothetical protein
MESGLLSEYSANRSFGQYLEFRDINENHRLDAVDPFILTGVGNVDDWGIVIMYVPTDKLLYSRTILNKPFFLEEHEYEYDPCVRFPILGIFIFGLLALMAYIQGRNFY